MPNRNLRGAILFIVIGVIMVVSVLAIAMFRTVSNQAGITDHQVNRIRAIYAAKAGMVLAFEKLRTGDWSPDTAGNTIRYYCIQGSRAPVAYTCTNGTVIDDDPDTGIPYNVQIAVCPPVVVGPPCDQLGIDGTTRLSITTDYRPPSP